METIGLFIPMRNKQAQNHRNILHAHRVRKLELMSILCTPVTRVKNNNSRFVHCPTLDGMNICMVFANNKEVRENILVRVEYDCPRE